MSTFWKRFALVAWDVVAWLLAAVAFVLVRHDLALSERMWERVFTYVAVGVVIQLAVGFFTHLYLGRSRIGSFDEVTQLGLLVLVLSVVLGIFFLAAFPGFSRGAVVLIPPLAFLLMVFGRWVYRSLVSDPRRARNAEESVVPALIYGAGDAGREIARLVHTSDTPPYRIVGFVDDDPAKHYLRIRGHRVAGRGRDLISVAEAKGAEVVVLAITGATPALVQRVADQCKLAGLRLLIIPPVSELIAGRVHLEQIRELDVRDLLGRREIEIDLSEIADYVGGKVVLVTGAGGSIGSELAQQVLGLEPAMLVLLDRDESAIHATSLRLYGSGLLDRDDLSLCDIRDREALRRVFERHRPDVVLHAAALKHLPMLERHPEEGWKTNVLGTLNVLQFAHEFGTRHFVNVSTDKAADPTSVLGQTKRFAERLTAWYATTHDLPYLSVRFGNVLGSRGSVLDTFRAQIAQGGPVTVTDREVTRFMMTIPEACELVLQAGAMGSAGDVLVLDMGEPVRIVDVAQRLIDESHEDIEIVFTGLREGEKMHEVLFSGDEHGTPSSHPLISQVSVPSLAPEHVQVDGETVADVMERFKAQRGPVSVEPTDPADYRDAFDPDAGQASESLEHELSRGHWSASSAGAGVRR
ncbi:polysaccharide biosynthesis protein [Knoellia subterranea]|uniref:Polysaccharide biosynthesis protein CapD n=1 Tax=Knoellia subterranea KCTC 19937 TaxID=1385521 RepID=A0A0A0JTY6_9MICO|nr:nucleoside-diphosphate sugar epimerase/dehydratase [Knoellia subterranea]KGN39136.1 polysaccharide biosynthesis protein CapD [Knoellia subterranea KCTC 19937]